MLGLSAIIKSFLDCISQFAKYGQAKIENQETTTNLITYKINGNEQDIATINKAYIDPGIVVYSNGIDVTDEATITVSCSELGTSNKNQKETYTFTKEGKYILKYNIKYNDEVETATRTITVSADSSNTSPEPTTPEITQ